MNRRKFIKGMTATGMGAIVFPHINSNFYQLFPDNKKKYSNRAIRLVKEATVIDMLNGFLDHLTKRDGKPVAEIWFSKSGGFTEEDYWKYRKSGINVFASGEAGTDYDSMINDLAKWNGFIASNSKYLERIDMSQKLDAISKSGKIGILLTYQNSIHFRGIDDVDYFYRLGQRVSQLTYNDANRLGYGAFEDTDKGLTEFGAKIIQRMNEIGMGVDVSHCGDKTTLDAIDACKKPVLITHAACRALNPGYARAKTDEAIKKVAATGGVIGIPMLRFMIREREPVSIENFLDHIDYAAKLVGVEHVGIGSDQDLNTEDSLPLDTRKKTLINAPPKYKVHIDEKYQISIDELNHPERTYDVTEGLIRRNYSDDNIKLILGENFKRVLKQIFIE